MLLILGVACLLALATLWLISTCRSKPSGVALAFPLFFLVVATVQSVPIPAHTHELLDPKGWSILDLAGLKGWLPLSLDPPETYREIAKAAAAFGVTLAALWLSNGRRLRFAATGLVASAGLAAMAVGLAHRAANEDLLYGHFRAVGGLLVGPLINPNHTAELLELSAFSALAIAFSRTTRDGARIWKVLAAILAAGAISTLSRGSVLALGSGALAWFLLAPKSDEGEPLRRSPFVAMLLALIVVVGLAIGLGGERIVDEFRGTVGDNLSKLAVARDSLSLVASHPAGIGLGAFGRVYPIYQRLPILCWYQFVENQPVGILLEAGIAGALCLLALTVWVGRRFWMNARRDRIEASMVAGLVAVVTHNLVDFGLEIPGVLLPFCAVLGTTFGRQVANDLTGKRAKHAITPVAGALAALAGIVLMCTPATRNFDALLKAPATVASLRDLARAASIAHPTDYAYALAEARLATQGSDAASIKTRLRLLNRAMLLCPRCTGAHKEAARNLWHLGLRKQSLLEWKIVVTESPDDLGPSLDELLTAGAKPFELASLADGQSRIGVTDFLLRHGMLDAATATLNENTRSEDAASQLMRARIALAARDLRAAKVASQRAMELAPRDPRVLLLAAEIALLEPNGSTLAIAILDKGLRYAPADIELNRKLLYLLMATDRWQAIDRALSGFRSALAESGAPSTDANVAAAQIYEKRGQYRRAISEYQAALGQSPDNPGLLLALAKTAEDAGSITVAIDAYNSVLRRDPENGDARRALARIQLDKRVIEVNSVSPPHSYGEQQ